MVHSVPITNNNLTCAAMAVIAAGALASAGLGSAPPAQATCASFFGIGNTAQCRSNLTSIAIALGTNAQAYADGMFGTAFAAGAGTVTQTLGTFTFATAMGDNAHAISYGLFGIAAQFGPEGYAETVGSGGSASGLGLNMAISISPGNTAHIGSLVTAYGTGNIAINLFGNGTTTFGQSVGADGVFNSAVAIGGTDNRVFAGLGNGTLNNAFSVLGSNNKVTADPGPLAVAGSILQTGATVTKVGPGIDVNDQIVLGGAAAVSPPSTAARHLGTLRMAPTGSYGGKTAAHANSGRKRI